MDPEYQAQLQRLEQFRRSLARQQKHNGVGSVQEGPPSQSHKPYEDDVNSTEWERELRDEPLQDPLMYPGIYAPSGFDMLGILIRVRTRPNPVIEIGNIDSSVALVLCDTALPDMPIVYCSEPFEAMTGYSSTDIIGRNCRFLQHPHPNTRRNATRTTEVDAMNAKPRAQLRESTQKGQETQVRLINYTKGGTEFFNLLTVIPIAWDEGDLGKRYVVGFQARDNSQFR